MLDSAPDQLYKACDLIPYTPQSETLAAVLWHSLQDRRPYMNIISSPSHALEPIQVESNKHRHPSNFISVELPLFLLAFKA